MARINVHLCKAVVAAVGGEYLREPNASGIIWLMLINTLRGFPGIVENINYMH
jgi:hypothetical protein